MLDYRALLGQSKLSSADKLKIQEAYLATFDKPMRLKNTNCKSCYQDALFELLNFKKFEREIMFNGRLLKTTTK
jgi:hypothetical protein